MHLLRINYRVGRAETRRSELPVVFQLSPREFLKMVSLNVQRSETVHRPGTTLRYRPRKPII